MLRRLAQYVRQKVRAFASPQAAQQPEDSDSSRKEPSPIPSDAEAEESFEDALLSGLDQVVEDLGLREKKPEPPQD